MFELRIDIDNCTLGELKEFVEMAVNHGARLDDYLDHNPSEGVISVDLAPGTRAGEEETSEDEDDSESGSGPGNRYGPEDDLRRERKFGSFAAEDLPKFDTSTDSPGSGPYFYDTRADRDRQRRAQERRDRRRGAERSRNQSEFDRLIDDFSDIARTVLDPRIGEAAVRSVLDAWDRRNGNGRYGNGRYGNGRYRR